MRRRPLKRFWAIKLEVWTDTGHISMTMPAAVALVALAMFFLWAINKLAGGAG